MSPNVYRGYPQRLGGISPTFGGDIPNVFLKNGVTTGFFHPKSQR